MGLVKTNIGIIGCGNISSIYLQNCSLFENLHVAACADLDLERARVQAQKFGVPRVCTVDELLADPDIVLVVNLTTPDAHGSVGLSVLRAGKSVYNEKPLALSRQDARALLALAREKGMRVGGAPDTFLGGGYQKCRQLIDEGAIGVPVAATAFFLNHGPEHWHPNAGFYYQPGAGPMFDMGPYYLTALVSLLGPVRRVTGSARISLSERVITSKPLYGTRVAVNTPTHISGVLDFANGAIGTVITSFDVWGHALPHIEIHGTEGSLNAPDPNIFGGEVRLRRGRDNWAAVPLSHGYVENSRGLGVADLASGLQSGRPHRASGELAYHVLDIMHAVHDASKEGRHIELTSACERPAPLPAGIAPWAIDG
jgi:predicted dehydrogenase